MTRARSLFCGVAAALALFVVSATSAAAAPFKSKYALAGHCVAMSSGAGSQSGVFYMKAAALGTYLLYDQSGQFVTATASGVTRAPAATRSSEWRVSGQTAPGPLRFDRSGRHPPPPASASAQQRAAPGSPRRRWTRPARRAGA